MILDKTMNMSMILPNQIFLDVEFSTFPSSSPGLSVGAVVGIIVRVFMGVLAVGGGKSLHGHTGRWWVHLLLLLNSWTTLKGLQRGSADGHP
jgi:hypothetical protein